MTQRETVDTTYADLRPSDLVIDKSGQAWPIAELAGGADNLEAVAFWLLDPVTKVKMHFMGKGPTDPVKVSRLPTQADEASKLEADFPKSSAPVGAGVSPTVSATTETPQGATAETTSQDGPSMTLAGTGDNVYANAVVSLAEAVAAVAEIGGTVEAEVTAEEVDAAAAATDDAPLTIIPFAEMTPLEQRSHLYLLHGVYGSDVVSKVELGQLHDQAHAATAAGTLNSRHVPHVHA
jgi:hypothetical protein